MARRLRSSKEDEFELGNVFERMVKGMRNEMNTVLWKIERSRDMSPEALKNLIRTGLESMVGAVEKVMNGVSDGMAKERKDREREEAQKEERARKMEEKIDRELREGEGKRKKSEDRLKTLEADTTELEKELKERGERMDRKGKETVKVIARLEEGGKKMEERLREEMEKMEKEDSKLQERLKGIEQTLIKERKHREELEREMEMERKVKEVQESEREMERKVEEAMEQIKILDLDFGVECKEKEKLVDKAVKIIKEKISLQDRKEWDSLIKGIRVYALGKCTGQKQTEKGRIHTVPVLLVCQCRSEKGRVEKVLKRAGLHVAFQWPKESMEFVNCVREKVERMGYERKEHFTRVRPSVVDGRVMIRVECRRKEGGKFEQLACWRLPPLERNMWECLNGILEPVSWQDHHARVAGDEVR